MWIYYDDDIVVERWTLNVYTIFQMILLQDYLYNIQPLFSKLFFFIFAVDKGKRGKTSIYFGKHFNFKWDLENILKIFNLSLSDQFLVIFHLKSNFLNFHVIQMCMLRVGRVYFWEITCYLHQIISCQPYSRKWKGLATWCDCPLYNWSIKPIQNN